MTAQAFALQRDHPVFPVRQDHEHDRQLVVRGGPQRLDRIHRRAVRLKTDHAASAARHGGTCAHRQAVTDGAAGQVQLASAAQIRGLLEAGLPDVRMLLQVHDELVFEADEAAVDDLIARAREVYAMAARLPGLQVVGIDMHIGSQLTDLDPYRQAYAKMAELCHALRGDGHAIMRLDMGGGLGIPYRRDNTAPAHSSTDTDHLRRLGHQARTATRHAPYRPLSVTALPRSDRLERRERAPSSQGRHRSHPNRSCYRHAA